MSEERESEERVAQGLGELPEDLEESRWPEGPGPERDEISRWTNNAAAVPAADLLAAQASGAPGMAGTAPAPEISQPVFQLLPEGAHPWTFSSDEKPRQPFYQDMPWTFEINNVSGYEAVLTELDWSLLPLSDVVQYMDVRLTAFLMGAPALGMRLLPVGQSAKLQTQIRIPTAGKLSLRASALRLPVIQPLPLWAPESLPTPRPYVRVGEKTYFIDLIGGGGPVNHYVQATGNWGESWEQLPDITSTGIVLQGDIPLLTAFGGDLIVFGEIGAAAGTYAIFASHDGAITWELWILDTSVIDADFVGTPVGAVVVDDVLCIVFWNLAGYTTFSTRRGHPENTWFKTIGNVLPVPPSVALSDVVEFAGKMVASYGMTSATYTVADKLVLAWSGDRGKTWKLVNTPMPFSLSFNMVVHGDQLWFLNGRDAAGGWPAETWWTDDLLNFHKASDVPWPSRRDCGVVASNERFLCFAGEDSNTTSLNESWSGGMVHSLAELVLHPMLRASGFYLPPRT